MKFQSENFKTLKSMLESSDQENILVAMECIENADFRTNMVYILFLIKEANIPAITWTKHAPETMKKFTGIFSVDINSASVSYGNIMNKLQVYGAPIEHYKFFMDQYAEHLVGVFNRDYEHPAIEEITINIKIKNYHESGTTGESVKGPDA